ncbi:transcription factor GTE11 [Zea mays]|uniref:transcription factor GTE11 n=1 Tax=Zea mays TaxID=4577 RepID=UPI0016525C32|nr:transcription factor GTE11 [Zea mays]
MLLLSQTACFISEICVPSSLFTSRFYICSESDYQDLLRNTDANQTALEYYSDSSSSSRSDTDAKAPQQNNGSKEKVLPVDGVDQEKDSLSTLNLPEQSTNPISVSADGEGGNVSEKQVSPDKQIRAALLRSRFADTILKAREKALDQTTKKDPEKLRREREELERVQREERARLQAEAKAAEDVRKRAEAAAAAEAKRQRELEREAARKALQEMEKTVDINEGSHFLKDLEMLGSVTGEQIPNLVGETSPGFQMGSNTLEKLGLYMKNDEDDEDGDFTDEPVADVEEGEID